MMVWGTTAVPSLGPVGLAFLIGLLIGAAFILQRRRLTQADGTCSVIAVAVIQVVAFAIQVSLPHSFPNGTVADATEVNANFEALRVANNKPIQIIVDSTGLSIVGEGEWAGAKYGERGRRVWKKLHLLEPSRRHSEKNPGSRLLSLLPIQ